MAVKQKTKILEKELVGIVFNREKNADFIKKLKTTHILIKDIGLTSTNNLRLETSAGTIYFQTDCNDYCGSVKLKSEYRISSSDANRIINLIRNSNKPMTILGINEYPTPSGDTTITIKLENNKGENRMTSLSNKMNLKFGKAPSCFGLNIEGKIAFDGKVYNAKTQELEDCLDLVFGEDMLYIMPVNAADLEVDDVIIVEDEPKQVISKGKTLEVADLKTGKVESIAKKKIFGFSFYSKVISPFSNLIGDTNNQMMLPFLMLAKDGNRDDMLPLLLLSQNNGNINNNQMLPLMLLAEKNGDNDIFAMMMLMQNQNGKTDMNNMLPLLMLSGDGNKKDMALMLMMMQQNQNQKPSKKDKKDSD